MLHTMNSGVPSKQRSGGQSAQRFERATEGAAKEYYRRVSEVMKEVFFENKKLKGILIGGPIPTKEEYIEMGNLATQLKDKIIGVRDIGDSEYAGLRALVESSKDILAEQEVTKQKEILDEFFMMLAKQPEKIAYGMAEVEERLAQGAVGKLVISKELSRDKIKHLEELAKSTSVEIHIVTTETQEGVQFLNIGGVGGILRYAVN
jgi:peptide chain release factor subunit 1